MQIRKSWMFAEIETLLENKYFFSGGNGEAPVTLPHQCSD